MTTDAEARAELFGSVFVLASRLTTATDQALADLGLTSRQWLLLAVLDTHFRDDTPTLTEAAAAYGSSRQNVKAIATALAQRGWLRLVPDAHDRRATRLELTERIAEFQAPALRRRGEDLLDTVFDGVPGASIATLNTLIRQWLAALGTTRPGRSTHPTRSEK